MNITRASYVVKQRLRQRHLYPLVFVLAGGAAICSVVTTATVSAVEFVVGKEVDLLPTIDLQRDSVGAVWKFENGELVSPNEHETFLQIPATPPPAYRLTIVGQRDEGFDLFAGLPGGGDCVTAAIDANGRTMSGLVELNGRWVQGNSTGRHFNDLLGDKRTFTVVCTVHPRSVLVKVNDIPVITWMRGSERISLPQHWRLPGDKLFVGGVDAVHRIRKLTLEALPEDDDINAALRKDGIVKLVYQTPLRKPKVGWDFFSANWVKRDDWPLAISDQTEACREFLYAHAPSKLVYELPRSKDPWRFSTVGYSTGEVRYRIYASDRSTNKPRPVFESDPCRIVNIDEPLRPNDRYVLLQIVGQEVPAFWLRPAVYQRKAKKKKEFPLADIEWLPFGMDLKNNEENDRFSINQLPRGVLAPLNIDGEHLCDEFLFAHAPSEVDYEIPPGAVSFSAIGYCLRSGDVEFQVCVDNQPDPISPAGKAAIRVLDVDIPQGAKQMRLVVNDLGNKNGDCSFWLYPRFHLATKKVGDRRSSAKTRK